MIFLDGLIYLSVCLLGVSFYLDFILYRSVTAHHHFLQVVQYQLVPESRVLTDAARRGVVDVGIGLGERWVFVGSKRTHTHDVNALVVAIPRVSGNMFSVLLSPKFNYHFLRWILW